MLIVGNQLHMPHDAQLEQTLRGRLDCMRTLFGREEVYAARTDPFADCVPVRPVMAIASARYSAGALLIELAPTHPPRLRAPVRARTASL